MLGLAKVEKYLILVEHRFEELVYVFERVGVKVEVGTLGKNRGKVGFLLRLK